MDGVRLTAAVALALTGCRGAAAGPGEDGGAVDRTATEEPRHGIDIPAGWTELAVISDAAEAAARELLGADAEVHAHAWGEPARGCFLAIVDAHGAKRDTVATVLAELEAGLGGALEISDWTTSPDAEDQAEVQGRFAGKGPEAMRGRIRGHIVLDQHKVPHALAATCFYNDRQPTVCDDACTPLLAMLQPLEPPPTKP